MEAKLVVVSGAARPSEFKLKLPTIIGRSRSVDLPVGHPLVSRQHCELFDDGGLLKIRDLGSLNGTFVNEERITEDTLLAPGATFTVGPLTFKAVYAAPEGSIHVPEDGIAVPEDGSPVPEDGELSFPDDSAEAPLAPGDDSLPPPAAAQPRPEPGLTTVQADNIGATVSGVAPAAGEADENLDWLAGAAAEGAAPVGEDDFLLAQPDENAFDTSFDSAIDIPQPAISPTTAAGKNDSQKTPPETAKKAAKAKKAEKAKPKGSAAEPKPAKRAEAAAPAPPEPAEELDFTPPPAHPPGEGQAEDLDNLFDFLQ